MNVSNVGSSCGTSQSAWQSQFKKVKDDFQKLKSALDSGDVSGAQDAYATLKQDLPAPKSNSSSSQPQTDLQSVGTALSSRDLSGAQKAFAAFQQDVQTARASHAHKHHHHPDADGGQDNGGNSSAVSNTTASQAGGSLFSQLA